MAITSFAANFIDPFGLIRKHLLRPATDFGYAIFDHYRTKTRDGVMTVKDLLLRAAIVLFAIVIILWVAVFMYVAFYYTYMPAIAHVRPVYMQFEPCEDQNGPCTFPKAHVSLTKKQQLLMYGQSYRVFVQIDMPESPQNQNLGMFMVCAELRDQKSFIRGHSCRSAMMHYKSSLVQGITTWALSPLFISGLIEERQKIPIELFANYEEEHANPVTDVILEIQSKQIQYYSVSLQIMADFAGIRYIMFHWPVLSAALGISTNLFFLLIIIILSWYHWSDTAWIDEARDTYQKFKKSKADLSLDDTNLLDDDDLSILEEKSSSKSDDIEELSSAASITDGDDGHKKPKLTQTDYSY